MTTLDPVQALERQGGRSPVAPAIVRDAKPVKWWAFTGGVFLVVQVYAYTRWIFSDNFTRVGSGPDPIPLGFRIAAHSAEVAGIGLMLFGGYRYLYRPWRDQRHLSAIGMMWLSGITIYWINFGVNWAAPVGNWSGAFWFNRGSWYNFIPGWVSPNGNRVAELSSFGLPMIVVFVGFGPMIFSRLLHKIKARWPQTGPSGMLLLCIGLGATFYAIVDPFILRAGLFTWGGSIPSITLFAGHYYQSPLINLPIFGYWFGLMTALVYFTDDHGRTWVERGLDRMQISKRKAGVMRFLAFTGFLNLQMIPIIVAWILVSIHPSFQWTDDVVGKRSYLNQGVCGPGTDVACPAKGTPILRKGGIYIDPDGNVVVHGKAVGKVPLDYSR